MSIKNNVKNGLALKKVEWKLKDSKTQKQSELHKPEDK